MKPYLPDTFLARGKGTDIRQAELEPLVGYQATHARYSLRVCQIADALMKVKRAAGDPCTIVFQKNDLRILTDAEASKYNQQRSDAAVRLLRRSHHRTCEVQVAKLTEEECREHDRRLVVTGARVALTSTSMVNKVASLGTHERILPGALSYRRTS